MMRTPARFFQLGYVCADLDQAIESLSPAQSSPFLILDVASLGGDPDNLIRRIALAYLGAINIELIEIDPERDSIFRSALPADASHGPHHFGYLVDNDADWAAIVEAIERDGTWAMSGEVEGTLKYLYADRRTDLGQFVEYVKLDEGGRALFANVPRGMLTLTAGLQSARATKENRNVCE